MISYQDALQIILKHGSPTQTEKLPLLSTLGKTSATDVKSAMDVPSFRNSAMDGFAVCCTDISSATMDKPVTLPVSGAIAAGDVVAAGKGAMHIMTGAPVPEPFDAVIPVEEVTATNDTVTFTRSAKTNENIRSPGEDVRAGQTALRRGDVITAERIMLLAALGVAEVETHKIPDIHILSTGKEIIDDHGSPLPQGKIYNSNAPYLMACCKEERFVAHYEGINADDAVEFETCVSAIPAGSMIITTGAVSKGVWDFIPESLKRLGAKTHFHRVNIRPGKPVLFAMLPNGSWFFGLPGNPVSTAIGFRFIVLPLMRALQGLPTEQPIMAQLENRFTKKGNFRQFLKAVLIINADGESLVTIASGQESFKISPMAESNVWAMLEENQTDYETGEMIPVFPFGKMPLFTANEELLCKAA